MSHDKAIKHGKEHRKPYRRSARFDKSCRNHGDCSWCEGNRRFFDRKRRRAAEMDMGERYETTQTAHHFG